LPKSDAVTKAFLSLAASSFLVGDEGDEEADGRAGDVALGGLAAPDAEPVVVTGALGVQPTRAQLSTSDPITTATRISASGIQVPPGSEGSLALAGPGQRWIAPILIYA